MYRAWQATIQVGMGALTELQKFKKQRATDHHSAMKTKFLTIWTQADVFCWRQTHPNWKLLLHRDFLPREFANRLKTIQIQDDPPTRDVEGLNAPAPTDQLQQRSTNSSLDQTLSGAYRSPHRPSSNAKIDNPEDKDCKKPRQRNPCQDHGRSGKQWSSNT